MSDAIDRAYTQHLLGIAVEACGPTGRLHVGPHQGGWHVAAHGSPDGAYTGISQAPTLADALAALLRDLGREVPERPTPERRHELATVGWSDCGHDDWRAGVVLDPFVGSGTTAVVARGMGRGCVGIDLNCDYLEIAARRTSQLSLLGGAA